MSKELVINSDGQTTRIAIVEKGELAELFIETEEHERTIGNLFVGKIRRVMPSIQAAFVDIGQKQDAFLHFSDLNESIPDWLEYIRTDKPQIAGFKSGHAQKHKGGKRRRPVSARPRKRLEDGAEDPEVELAAEQGDDKPKGVVGNRDRHRRKGAQKPRRGRGRRSGGRHHNDNDDGVPPESFLQRDQPILVKISKEPIAQKGSRVTTDISLAGRFLVLVPMANYVAVSKKISSFKERRRLRALAKMLLPDGFGVIVRTVAEGQNAKALDTDLRLLREKWDKVEARLAERPKPPAPIYEDVNMVSSIMRDLFSEDFDRILIDDQRVYRNIKGYVQAIAPEMGAKVKLHDKNTPVFKAVGINRSVGEAFESRVNLPSGGYLYIEQTEAMHVIDVNSGRAGKGLSQEDNSLKVNLEAARVIARQIRLRDLGGILVIDFIDMRSERSRRKIYEQMRREFRKDRAVTKVLPMSDFGLMQITRQRLRPSITHTFSDLHEENMADSDDDMQAQSFSQPQFPSSQTRERPRPVEPDEVVGRIEDWLEAFGTARWKGAIRLRVHPFTAAYLSKGVIAFGLRCLFKYRIRLILDESPSMEPGRFRFYDETNGKEIRRPPRRGRKKKRDAKPKVSRAPAEAGAKEDSPSSVEAAIAAPASESRAKSDSAEKSESRGRSRGASKSGSRSRSRTGSDASSRDKADARSSRGGGGKPRAEKDANERRNEDSQASGDDRRGSRSRGRGRKSPDADTGSPAEAAPDKKAADSGDSRASKSRRRPQPRTGRKTDAEAADRKDGSDAKEQATVKPNSTLSADNAAAASEPKAKSRAKVEDTGDTAAESKAKPRAKADDAGEKTADSKGNPRAKTQDDDQETAKPKAKPRVKSGASQAKAPQEPGSSKSEPAESEAPAREVAVNESDGEADKPVRPKTPGPQPFKLRYSSSHVSESDQV